MKRALILLALAVPALAQQAFDFSTLDKLGAKAKGTTNITLDGSLLKLATSFLDDDDEADSIKALVKNLSGIYIRGYTFDRPGQYNEADLAPLRAYVKSLQWTRIVDVRDEKENTEIYVQSLPNDRVGGLAIISSEPAQIHVVFISGSMNVNDIEKLGGNLGIPELPPQKGKKSGSKSANSNKSDKGDKD